LPEEPFVPPPSSQPSTREDLLFQKEMARQGIQSRDGRKIQSQPEEPEDDAQLFLAAMADLPDATGSEETEKDGLGEVSRQAKARRARRLERGEVRPAEQVDLHGLTRTEALSKVHYFLEHAVFRGDEAVLIITGKGSVISGPVLKQAIQQALNRDFRKMVLEWCPAPARYGGAGAMVVFLRPRS